MKKFNKSKFQKQLVSGGIYIALAAAVVTVTLNGVNRIISDNEDYNIPDIDIPDTNFNLDAGPDISISDKSPFDTNIIKKDNTDKGNVPNQSKDGGAEKTENQPFDISADVADNVTEIGNTSEASGVETGVDANVAYEYESYGIFAKPAQGYISREYADDKLLYSVTMGDYRTHKAIDITGDIGSPVKAISDGVVEKVYFDDFHGYTVAINHGEVTALYMNLSQEIPKGIEAGANVVIGQTIGGIGQSSAVESADVAHLHLVLEKDGKIINPEEYLK